MAINFPATGGQATDGSYTYTVAGIVYSWNGSSWEAAGAGASATDRSLFSVTTNAAGTPALSYTSSTGVFEYTPPEAENDTFDDVVARGSTVLRDVIFGDYTGATGAPKIQYDDANNRFWFKPGTLAGNSAEIWLGNGISYNNMTLRCTGTPYDEAQIFVDNADLQIWTNDDRDIKINSSNDIFLQNAAVPGVAVLDNGIVNGHALSVELYWGSSAAGTGGKKLETTTNGVTITGALTAGGLTFPTTNGTANDVLISDGSGGVTWSTPAGLQSRTTASVTQTIASLGISNTQISTPKSYALMKIQTTHAAWVTLYSSTSARTSDASRVETTDPTPGSGVLAEVITTGAQTQMITPATVCFNEAATGTTYVKIVNKSGSTANVGVTLTYLQLEA